MEEMRAGFGPARSVKFRLRQFLFVAVERRSIPASPEMFAGENYEEHERRDGVGPHRNIADEHQPTHDNAYQSGGGSPAFVSVIEGQQDKDGKKDDDSRMRIHCVSFHGLPNA